MIILFYVWDITVPADTAELNPIYQKLKLSAGIITNINIKFPDGCNGMVKVRILRWTFQLVPLSNGEWVTGNGETVPTETSYELLEVPFELEFQACSPSTSYPHKITIRIEVSPTATLSDLQIIESLNKIVEAVTVNG